MTTPSGVAAQSTQTSFSLDFPGDAKSTLIDEGERTHTIIILNDRDMLRWQARVTSSRQDLNPTQKGGLFCQFENRKTVSFTKDGIHYTLVSRSLVLPVTDPVHAHDSENSKNRDLRKVPTHMRSYLKSQSEIDPDEIAFYNDPCFQNSPPKPKRLYRYKPGDTIWLPVDQTRQPFEVMSIHKGKKPFVEIRNRDSLTTLIVPKGYVDQHNPPTTKQKIIATSALIAFQLVIPGAMLFLSAGYLLWGKTGMVMAMGKSGFKARWRKVRGKCRFVLHPGCSFSVGSKDRYTDQANRLGKGNPLYHLYRRHAGVLEQTDLEKLLSPAHTQAEIHLIWECLVNEGFLSPYKDRKEDVFATQKILCAPDALQKLLKRMGLDVAEKHLTTLMLENYLLQHKQKPDVIDEEIVPTPYIAITDGGDITLLDHRRIFAAMDFGIPIVVETLTGGIFSNRDSSPYKANHFN